jgi:2-C-methyl-D-erythritol 2,4-cyclodiphosphate synthase
MRIGLGYDIHRFQKGRKLFLGGRQIKYPLGLAGHSDADVVLHAICDSILGALGAGDIGEHFPNRGKKWKDISSRIILEKTAARLKNAGYKIVNLDVSLLAEEPKISPFKNQMERGIAQILKISPGQINLKATTMEGLGEIGRKKGIACLAVCLLEKKK